MPHTASNPLPSQPQPSQLYVIGVLKIKLYCYRGGRGVPDPTRSIINSFAVVFTVITLLVQKWLLFILRTCVRVVLSLFIANTPVFRAKLFLYKNGGRCVYLDGSWLMLNMCFSVGVGVDVCCGCIQLCIWVVKYCLYLCWAPKWRNDVIKYAVLFNHYENKNVKIE